MVIRSVGKGNEDGPKACGSKFGHCGGSGPAEHKIRLSIAGFHVFDKGLNAGFDARGGIGLLHPLEIRGSGLVREGKGQGSEPGQGLTNDPVEAPCALTASQDEKIQGILGSAPALAALDQVGSYGIARHTDSFRGYGKRSVGKGYVNFLSKPGKETGGEPRKLVLFMENQRNAHAFCGKGCGCCGVSSHGKQGMGFEGAENGKGFPKGPGKAHQAQKALPESLSFQPGCGNGGEGQAFGSKDFLVQGSCRVDKKHPMVRRAAQEGFGHSHPREKVASGASACDEEASFFQVLVHAFLLAAAIFIKMPMAARLTTREVPP
jgi:hypothetical protein